MSYCVYFHINPLRNEVFYVGIGRPDRPYDISSRTRFWKSTVKKYGRIVDLVHEDLSWEQACELEKFYIKRIGRRDKGLGSLVNMTDGGDGTPGYHHSIETRDKMSKTRTGVPLSAAHKASVARALTGKKLSKEHIAAMVAAQTGCKHSAETRAKWSELRKGVPKSSEHRAKIAASLKGKTLGIKRGPHSQETKDKIANAKRGKPRSAETRAKISKSLSGRKHSDTHDAVS